MQPYRNHVVEKYENNYLVKSEGGTFNISSNTKTFSLVSKNTIVPIYDVWTSCDEPFSKSIGDKGQYIARISLMHHGLKELDWANERKNKNKKKKKF